MVSYQAIKENFENDELGSYVSYSIAAFKIENQKRKQLTYIADVFTNKYLAEKYYHLMILLRSFHMLRFTMCLLAKKQKIVKWQKRSVIF